MIAQHVSIPSGGSEMPAYLARPEDGSGEHPAVIVLHEVFGLTPGVQRAADLLASLGYAALAIDYYHRTRPGTSLPYTAEGSRQGYEIAQTLTIPDVLADVTSAMAWLDAQPFVEQTRIATCGFGFGGTLALATASLQELSGAVAFYPDGVLEPMPDGKPFVTDVTQIAVPVLVLFGEQDYFVERYDMDRIYHALRDAGKDVRMNIYPLVGHSFFRHGSPQAIAELRKYSDQAIGNVVADSWNVVSAFLADVFSRETAGEHRG